MQDPQYNLTIIIPTYNRAETLEMCLKALAEQSAPARSFQVIVVDDGSTDDTRERAGRFSDGTFGGFRYIRQENSGQNAARNRAITEAAGDVLLFINDDTIAEKNMIREHEACRSRYPGDNVAILGRVTLSPELVSASPLSRLHLDTAFARWQGEMELDWHAFYTCNLSVKKSFLMQNGLFDTALRYHDDIELGSRLAAHGLRVIYDPEALGYHYHDLSEKSYFNLARASGKALAMWYRKAPGLAEDLAILGFYLTAPGTRKLRYIVARLLVNKVTMPAILALARFMVHTNQNVGLALYNKIFKALERESIRDEMRR